MSGISVNAAEPILTLAMARFDHSASRRIQNSNEHSNSNPLAAVAALTSSDPSLATETGVESPSLSASCLLERSKNRITRSPLRLTREVAEGNVDIRLWASASIQAGYGEIYREKPARIYGHNGTGWEEPGCGYVKIQLRF
jgi:hypothetical protein